MSKKKLIPLPDGRYEVPEGMSEYEVEAAALEISIERFARATLAELMEPPAYAFEPD